MAESQRGWYRKRSQSVDVLRYNGEFPLDFLRPDEQIRSAGPKGGLNGDIHIEAPDRCPVFAALGYVIIREADGTLTTYPSAEHFDVEYEAAGEIAVQVSGRTAISLRYILPLVATALEHADDDGETTAMLEQATQDIDRALPPEFRGAIDDHEIAEARMDAIDAQRKAGVRPPAEPVSPKEEPS